MNILILREEEIRRTCTMPQAIDAAIEALKLQIGDSIEL